MQFAEETDRQDIEKVTDAFQRHCIGEVNVTYERYVFNRRVQDTGETFDAFLADLRRLACTCDFETLEESIICDRIVIGIREDSTRRKLLQTRKLDLQAAIDACNANEIAMRQLRAISTPEEVDALAHPGTRASTSRTLAHQQQRRRGERQHTSESRVAAAASTATANMQRRKKTAPLTDTPAVDVQKSITSKPSACLGDGPRQIQKRISSRYAI